MKPFAIRPTAFVQQHPDEIEAGFQHCTIEGESTLEDFLTDKRALFVILAAKFLSYSNSPGGQFVFDDTRQRLKN